MKPEDAKAKIGLWQNLSNNISFQNFTLNDKRVRYFYLKEPGDPNDSISSLARFRLCPIDINTTLIFHMSLNNDETREFQPIIEVRYGSTSNRVPDFFGMTSTENTPEFSQSIDLPVISKKAEPRENSNMSRFPSGIIVSNRFAERASTIWNETEARNIHSLFHRDSSKNPRLERYYVNKSNNRPLFRIIQILFATDPNSILEMKFHLGVDRNKLPGEQDPFEFTPIIEIRTNNIVELMTRVYGERYVNNEVIKAQTNKRAEINPINGSKPPAKEQTLFFEYLHPCPNICPG